VRVTPGAKLPDVLAPNLRVWFCGTAAGTQSAKRRAYYAGPGNRFWSILHEIGITPKRLEPHEYRTLLTYGIGLTDVCKTSAGMDSEIPADAFEPAALLTKLEELEPTVIAFNGKKAARVALRLTAGAQVAYGHQQQSLGGAAVWVLPSTSGAANGVDTRAVAGARCCASQRSSRRGFPNDFHRGPLTYREREVPWQEVPVTR
jgi:double-stranded uracil-DNA glycosylase